MNWLKPIDIGRTIERISIRKLIVVGCFSIIGCTLFVAYLIWSKPPSCAIHDNKLDGNGTITCSGEVRSADKAPSFEKVVPRETTSPIASQEQMNAAIAALATQLEQPKQRIIVVVIADPAPQSHALKPMKNPKRQREEPDDPLPARKVFVIPDSDLTDALTPKIPLEHSCLIDKFPTCYMSRDDRAKTMIKIPIDDYLAILQGHGLR